MTLTVLLSCSNQDKQAAQAAFSSDTEPQGFSIQETPDGYDLDLIRFYLEEPDTLHYEFRAEPDSGQIPWPARRIVILSATQLGMVIMADAREAIVATDRMEYAFDEQVRAAIDSGEILEVGESGQLDLEAVLSLQPDLVMISGFPEGMSREVARLEELGIPLLPVAEWQETHPLARSAWALVVAAALGKYDLVAAKLDTVRHQYGEWSQSLAEVEDRPLVLTGSPFQGIWYVPAGESFLATLIRDAGGRTAWESEPGSASLTMDPEVVYPVGLSADFWINPGAYRTMKELTGAFPRYESFPAVTTGRVYNYDRQAQEDGANAYWEQAALRPDLVLKDLISIFHPSLLEDTSQTFYRRLSP